MRDYGRAKSLDRQRPGRLWPKIELILSLALVGWLAVYGAFRLILSAVERITK